MRRPLQPRSAVVALLCVVAALAALAVLAAAGAGTADAQSDDDPCLGTVTSPANGTTVISTQGVRFTDDGAEKTMPYVMAVGERGRVEWVHDNGAEGRRWTYDVDPLEGGTYLVATTEPGTVVVAEYDPRTDDHVWEHTFENAGDAHDVDLVDGELIVADKGNNRIFAYDREREEITWQWNFSDHFPASHGGPPDDWTHLNDVDAIDEHRYLLSAKHFNQVLIINRTTGEVEETIGDDDDPSILDEQHNPQYQVSEDGTPTVLVADSENDRVVEFERRGGEWEERYVLRGGGLHEPRDADWLPNGNLLISDRLGQRVLEVTPGGEVVWEVYAPWQPYDAERVVHGDEPDAPNSVDLNVSGTHRMESESVPESDLEACAEFLERKGRENASGVGSLEPVSASTVRTVDRVPFGLAGVAVGAVLAALAVGVVGWTLLSRRAD